MHNLIKEDLDKLEDFSREQHSSKYYDDEWWGDGKSDYHDVNGSYPGDIALRVIKKFENKSFDQAFAYYCTLVPKYQQKIFMEQLESTRSWRRSNYTVINGMIRKKNDESKKKIYTLYSEDFLSEYRHKITDKSITANEWRNGNVYVRTKGRYWGSYNPIKRSDYELVILQGWKKDFESRFDPRYIKILRERRDKKRKAERYWEKEKQNKVYSFLTNSEIEKKKLALTDKATRDRHGFDETTFMGIEYHGQKRKLKEKL